MAITTAGLIKSSDSFLLKKIRAQDFDDTPFNTQNMSFHLCVSAEFDIDVNNVTYHLKKNDMLILFPKDTIRIYNSKDAVVFGFFITKGFSDIAFRGASIQAKHILRSNRVYKSELVNLKRLLKMVFLYKKCAMIMSVKKRRTMLIGNLVNTAIIAIANDIRKNNHEKLENFRREETKVKGSSIIEKFMYLVDIHYREEHKVQFYAKKLKITPNYLTNLCSDYTGESPKSIIESKILSSLKNDLLHSDYSLQELAQLYRFPDVSYMGRFFKRNAGCTPNTFRTSVN